MNIRKRFIAYIMCYVLALSMIPAPVSGADGDGVGTETCEHEYKVLKYVWGYEAEGVWKDSLVNVASVQSPNETENETDFDANESWEGKIIQCKAVLACKLCHDEYTETVSTKISEDKEETFPATCQKGGKTTYIALFNNKLCEQQKAVKETPVDSTAHKYGEPTWTWNPNGDSYAAEAVFKCTNNNCNDAQTETGTVTSVITEEASCVEDGIKTYTATVTFGGKDYEGSKTDKIEKTGHKYGEPTWTWNPNGDGYAAEAVFKCTNSNCTDTQKKNGTVNSSIQGNACTGQGTITYTASVNFENKEYFAPEKTETINKIGHKYGEPTWTWNPNGDSYAAEAVFKCTNNNCDDTQSETGEVTSVITKEASCIEGGIKTYTATVTFGGKDYEGSKTDKIEKTGHNYGQPTWTWNPNGDSYDAEASFTCNRCDEQTTDHIVTLQDDDVIIEEEITEASTCMKQGTKTYVASVIFEEQEYKDTEGIKQLLPLSGHNTQKMSEARPATCIADGTIEYYYCKTCKKHFSDKSGTHELSNGSWIIKAKNHQISDHLQPSTNSENGSLIRSCDVCGLIQEKFPIPKKKMKIEIGEELSAQFDDAMDSSKCTFVLKNKKDKKYFKLNKNTGKISVQEKYYAKISKKPIVVNVSTGAGTYPVKVTPQIPAPKIKKIASKKEGDYYRFTFKYNIKGADKIVVRCSNIKGLNPKGFDKYLSKPKSNSDSYVYIKVGKLKKVTFTVTAYYGKNVSNTAKIQVPIKK